nr:GNAT family N-acetyltransferase [uncultured Pedobacter sp.]
MKDKILKLLTPLLEFDSMLVIKDLDEYVTKIIANAYIIYHFDRDILVGFIAFYINKQGAYLTMLAVDSRFHGKKNGQLLLESSIEAVKVRGCKIYKLEVHKKNHNAISLYRKFDFKTVDENASHYTLSKAI